MTTGTKITVFSLFLWWLKTVFLSHTKNTHTKEGGGARARVGRGFSSDSAVIGGRPRSQLVFVVAKLGEGHFPAELHHLPEHLFCCKHRGRQEVESHWYRATTRIHWRVSYRPAVWPALGGCSGYRWRSCTPLWSEGERTLLKTPVNSFWASGEVMQSYSAKS